MEKTTHPYSVNTEYTTIAKPNSDGVVYDLDDGFESSNHTETYGWLKKLKSGHRKPYHISSHTLSDNAYQSHIVLDICKYIEASRRDYFLCYFVMQLLGQRRLMKHSVHPVDLSSSEYAVYKYTQQAFEVPGRADRIISFLSGDRRTKRMINYFAVHYISTTKMSYYLDRTSYPYHITGGMNTYDDPVVLAKIANGVNITWIDLNREYRLSKQRFGRHRMHAPYARSVTVDRGDSLKGFSLCELNFYVWMDEVGGMEAFEYHETQIRINKKLFDSARRRQNVSTISHNETRHALHNQYPLQFTVHGIRPRPFSAATKVWCPVAV
jgi:hypothetical protein